MRYGIWDAQCGAWKYGIWNSERVVWYLGCGFIEDVGFGMWFEARPALTPCPLLSRCPWAAQFPAGMEQRGTDEGSPSLHPLAIQPNPAAAGGPGQGAHSFSQTLQREEGCTCSSHSCPKKAIFSIKYPPHLSKHTDIRAGEKKGSRLPLVSAEPREHGHPLPLLLHSPRPPSPPCICNGGKSHL